MVVLLATGQAAFAQVIMVTTTADVIDPFDGECSLREAVIVANTNAALGDPRTGECPAGDDLNTDTILLESKKVYALTILGSGEDASMTGDLDVLDNTAAVDVIFAVSGTSTSKISAASLEDRVLHIVSGHAVVDGIMIADGNSVADGGAIRNDGELVLDNSRVVASTATVNGGGIFNTGALTLQNKSAVGGKPGLENTANQGGGIYNTGDLLILSSTVMGNVANVDGGGLYNRGPLTIDAGSVTDNMAEEKGGGIYNDTYDPADFMFSDVVLRNGSMVSGNEATDGGGIYSKGHLLITGSFVNGNMTAMSGAGIYSTSNTGEATIERGSEVSYNTSGYTGGGIFNTAEMLIDASTIAGNQSATGAGGVANFVGNMIIQNGTVVGGPLGSGEGNVAGTFAGGVYNNGQLVIDASTITGNEAQRGAGLGAEFGMVEVRNGTVISYNFASDKGGGVYTLPSADALIESSILTRNVATGNGEALYTDAANPGQVVVHSSCIISNGTGVGDKDFYNANIFTPQDATDNWWGDASGPAPFGTGESFMGNWSLTAAGAEWLVAAPAICP